MAETVTYYEGVFNTTGVKDETRRNFERYVQGVYTCKSSGGTATVTAEGSVDGINYAPIGSIVLALGQVGDITWNDGSLSFVRVNITAVTGDVTVHSKFESTAGSGISGLTQDEIDAINNAPTAPTAANPFMTQADVAALGGGDMLKSTYDPTNVSGDAFDMANMVEAANAKVLTASERTKIAAALTAAEIDSLAELNAIITDANLDDAGSPRTPTAHAASHTDGTDDIQDATATQKGLMTIAYASKLEGIEPNAKDDQNASEVPFNNTTSGLTATDAQAAIDEVEGRVDTLEGSSHAALTLGGAPNDTTDDTLDLVGQSLTVNLATGTTDGAMSAADKSKLDGVEPNAKDDQNAAEVPYSNTTSGLVATDAQAAIDELDTRIDNIDADIGTRLLAPVQDQAALEAIDTTNAADYPDKSLINVEDLGLYRLDRDSADAADGTRIIAPTTGTGRWFKMTASINDHNNLSNIQGGTTGERNHLTNAELTDVQAIDQVFTAGEKTKLSGIEPNAKDDQSAAEVPYTNTTSGLAAVDVQAAIDEVEGRVDANDAKVSADGSINTHSDVDTTTTLPQIGEVLEWDGANWVPADKGDQQGDVSFNGQISFDSPLTPPTLAANVNDYNPAGLADANFLRLSSSTPINITGLAAPSPAVGQVVLIKNVGSSNVTVINNSGLSLAANRFDMNSNIIMQSGEGVTLVYDVVDSRWAIISKNV